MTLRDIRRRAKKPENFWFRVFYFLSAYVVWVAMRAKVTPNQLTLAAFALNLGSLVCFLSMSVNYGSIAVLAALLTLAHVLDCADGHLAFTTDRRSECGYWLDSALDIFKSAFVSLCFCRIVLAVTPAVGVGRLIGNMALLASMGVFINYALSLHAGKYKQRVDTYELRQIDTIRIAALASVPVRVLLSHVREYGNVLVVLAVFSINAKLGLGLLIGMGFCHFALALHRVYRIACLLRSQESGVSGAVTVPGPLCISIADKDTLSQSCVDSGSAERTCI